MCAGLAAHCSSTWKGQVSSQKDAASQMGLTGAVNVHWADAGRKEHYSKGWEL